jgi:hypothetical protein
MTRKARTRLRCSALYFISTLIMAEDATGRGFPPTSFQMSSAFSSDFLPTRSFQITLSFRPSEGIAI